MFSGQLLSCIKHASEVNVCSTLYNQ